MPAESILLGFVVKETGGSLIRSLVKRITGDSSKRTSMEILRTLDEVNGKLDVITDKIDQATLSKFKSALKMIEYWNASKTDQVLLQQARDKLIDLSCLPLTGDTAGVSNRRLVALSNVALATVASNLSASPEQVSDFLAVAGRLDETALKGVIPEPVLVDFELSLWADYSIVSVVPTFASDCVAALLRTTLQPKDDDSPVLGRASASSPSNSVVKSSEISLDISPYTLADVLIRDKLQSFGLSNGGDTRSMTLEGGQAYKVKCSVRRISKTNMLIELAAKSPGKMATGAAVVAVSALTLPALLAAAGLSQLEFQKVEIEDVDSEPIRPGTVFPRTLLA